ncbi:MAG: response regulator [Ruminiclostridium sp.]|nr:response regulator [Ruminiclostridium sp.]
MAKGNRENGPAEKGTRSDYIRLAFIVAGILAVVGMNIIMIFSMMFRQTEQVGEAQLDKVGGDLENTLSDAERIAMKVAFGAEKIGTDEGSRAALSDYITEKKSEQIYDTGGLCFNVYAAGTNWQITPDFDAPDDFHPKERLWYIGADEDPGSIYITEPYIDVVNGITCFTASVMLSDNDAVVSVDFNLSEMQESITKMLQGHADRQAIIVTRDGTIAGYNDMTLAGTNIWDSLPEYADVFERVVTQKEHTSFRMNVDGSPMIVFSSETNNEWYLILCFNTASLYSGSYLQIILCVVLNLLLVVVIVLFYNRSILNRVKAQKALRGREDFMSNLSRELRTPLNRLLKKCDTIMTMSDGHTAESVSQIKESGLQLSEMMDSLFTYSAIVSRTKEEDAGLNKRDRIELPKASRLARNSVISILVVTFIISQIMCIYSTYNWGQARLGVEALRYEDQVTEWGVQQQSILSMFTTMISKHPDHIANYDEAVAWLDSIACKYPDISVCYVANPYLEHQVIMNNGWEPGPGWRVEERPWYKDTEKSPTGFNISVPYIDDQTGNYCITMSQIIYGENNEFIGIFAIDYFMDKLINVLGESYTKNSYAFLVDSDGKIVNHPDPDYQMHADGTTMIADTVYKDIYFGNSDGYFRDYDGTVRTGMVRKSNDVGFTIIVVNDWWNIYGNTVLFCALFFILFGACIVSVAILINRLIKWQEQANNKLREAADIAVSAVKSRSEFFAQMSHEIRTPINAVLGMNEMIMRESTDSSILEYASNIGRAGSTLLTLINSILDFSKLESGKLELIPVSYEVLSLLDDIIIMTKERAVRKGLELRLDIDPVLPKSLFGDDVRLRQVIVNIMTNALKYTNEGSVSLKVSGSVTDDEVCELFVSVTDTGIGIREEDIEKLFHSFERLDEEKNRNIEGTGLGISIVRQLLAMMDSKLDVKSVYGKGSTFSFTVKQKIVDRTPIGSYETHVSAVTVRESSKDGDFTAEKADVLVTDDNAMNLMVAKGLMKRLKIVPDLTDSGVECIAAMKKKHYDIVFLDHMMPEMDGVETLHKLQDEALIPRDTVMIALTANAVNGAKEYYLGEGFADYLSKPIEVRKLESLLRKYLPADKVKANGSAENEPPDSEPAGLTERLASRGFNTEAGLKYAAGSEEFYTDLLNTFAAEHDAKSAELRKAFEERDWKLYRTKVHALKSAARTIGADALADLAFEHEKAAKDEQGEFITDGFERLEAAYSGVVGEIVKVCGDPLNKN